MNPNTTSFDALFAEVKRVYESSPPEYHLLGAAAWTALTAIKRHHEQKADDRCHFDDATMYVMVGLPPADHGVGSKAEMRKNCDRFIEARCTESGWMSYADLVQAHKDYIAAQGRLNELVTNLLRQALDYPATGPVDVGMETLALRVRLLVDQLRCELDASRRICQSFAARINDQSEIIAKQAEKSKQEVTP